MKPLIPLAVTILALTPAAQARWQEYGSTPMEDYFEAPTPPVNEMIKFGGFALEVDQTQLGFAVYAQNRAGMLAQLNGDEIAVNIFKVPSGGKALDELAQSMNRENASRVKISPVRSRFGLKGVRASYGEKPTMFSQKIQTVRYFFVNPSGETICFEAKAKTPYVDWDYFDYLVPETLRVSKA